MHVPSHTAAENEFDTIIQDMRFAGLLLSSSSSSSLLLLLLLLFKPSEA